MRSTTDLTRRVRTAATSDDPVAALAAVAAHLGARPALWTLASMQDGQFTTSQARTLGLSPAAVRWLARDGRSEPVARGVHRVVGATGGPDPAVTAFLRCWPTGTLGYGTAAHHHGISAHRPPEPEVIVPRSSYRRLQNVRVHQSRRIDRDDRAFNGSVAYTSVARTLCDLASNDDPGGTLARVDAAVAAGASPRWIHDRALTMTGGRDGVTLVRDATAPGAAPAFRSWLERSTATLIAEAGLPAPVWNVPVVDGDGTIGLVDALWRPWRVVVEVEGLRFHTSPAARRRDASRFNRLLAVGLVVRRFTWQDVTERARPTAVTIAEALRRAGAPVDPAAIPEVVVLPSA